MTLIDIIDEHVRRAKALGATVGFKAKRGDARHFDEADASADACLLLGPLYHLRSPDDRVRVLAEAVRVTRPGGLVVAAAISRYSWPLDALRQRDLSEEYATAMRKVIDPGVHDPQKGFTTSYLHRPDELVTEFSTAGLAEVNIAGIEGPGWILSTPRHFTRRGNRSSQRSPSGSPAL